MEGCKTDPTNIFNWYLGGNGKDNSTKKDNLLNEWYHDAYTPGERKRGRSRGREMNLDVDLILILPQSRQ